MSSPWLVIWSAWLVTFAIWIGHARGAKPTEHSQNSKSRALHVCALACTALLMGFGPHIRILPPNQLVESAGALGTAVGCALAISARRRLGSNWSPHAAVQANHELIESDAYAITRHPIYTGILTALAFTALALGQLRGVFALIVLAISFHYKATTEEALMQDRFGARYAEYCRRVKRLVPFVW